jgi:multidrug efflux pump subunit AcrA (membrane-fusion protein)
VVEVRVPLDSRELAWFDIPSGRGLVGPRAEVSVEFGGRDVTWVGRVTRMEAQVDQTSRMIHVVVEIADPYEKTVDHPPLLPGTFVDVRIFGRTLESVVALPRFAIREGNRVWVYEDGSIQVREVEILRADRLQSLVASGLEGGDLVVVSTLDAVTDGMKVRRAGDESAGGSS